MTESEAIRVLKEAVDSTQEEYDTAFNLAIDALEKQSMVNEILNEAEQYKLALFAVIRNPQLMSCGKPVEEVNMIVVKAMENIMSMLDYEKIQKCYSKAKEALAKMGGK